MNYALIRGFGSSIIIGLAIYGFIKIYFFVCDWQYGNHYPRIKFSTFEHMYNIAPERWGLHDDYCHYDIHGVSHSVSLSFSIIDFVKYRIFCKQIEKEKEDESRKKCMLDCVESWQKDIDRYKKEHKI